MDSKDSITSFDSINANAPIRGLCGVYQIRNTVNDKTYIGSASDIRRRWLNHAWVLNDGSSHSKYLQSAWIKYGHQSFIFEVLELVAERHLLIAREQFYIDMVSPAYNMCPAAGKRTLPLSEETKLSLRRPKSEETKRRMSEAGKRAYELNPALRQARSETFKMIRETNPDYNRGPNNGMFGVSLDRLKMISPEAERRRVEIIKQMHRDGRFVHKTKPVEQLTDGIVVRLWPSLIEAASGVGRTPSTISNACRGRIQTCAGFQWRYAT